MARKFNLNSRTVVAPIAAFTMAGLLFVYSRTSIQAAKRNAQRHREADGGQISWHNESLRRHGQLERQEEPLLKVRRKDGKSDGTSTGPARSEEEEMIMELARRKGRN